MNIKNDKTKTTLTHIYNELTTNKPPRTSVWARKRYIRKEQRKQIQQEVTLYTKQNEIIIDFSRNREYKRSTSRMFVILIVLNYKKARQGRQRGVVIQSALGEVAC